MYPSDNKKNISKKILHIFIVFIFLAGCAPLTMQEVRDKSPKPFTFDIDEGYKSVYQKIFSKAEWRYVVKFNVDGNLYTGNESGSVTVTTPIDLLGTAGIYMTIDIKALSENKTRVTTYYGLKSWKNRAKEVEEWIK